MTVKICCLCGCESEKAFSLLSPEGGSQDICEECIEDFFEYVNSGKADDDRMYRRRNEAQITLAELAKTKIFYDNDIFTKGVWSQLAPTSFKTSLKLKLDPNGKLILDSS
jgi:hypothetical protein